MATRMLRSSLVHLEPFLYPFDQLQNLRPVQALLDGARGLRHCRASCPAFRLQIGETAIAEARELGKDVAQLEEQLAAAQAAAGTTAADWEAAAAEAAHLRPQLQRAQDAAGQAEAARAQLQLQVQHLQEQGAAADAWRFQLEAAQQEAAAAAVLQQQQAVQVEFPCTAQSGTPMSSCRSSCSRT